MKMQDKRAAQDADRERHLAEIRAVKERRSQAPVFERAPETRTVRQSFLILCQGTNTEVDYFEHFELATADVKALGRAYDPEKLVEEAMQRREAARRQNRPYDQVWCVFDKDDSSAEQVHAALAKAKAAKIKVAFSNQAFEFWLLLHFDDHQGGGMSRTDCAERLSALIAQTDRRVSYDGKVSKRISRELFDLLEADDPTVRRGQLPRRKVAVGRARAIDKRWVESGQQPAYQESTTGVYRLVLELQKHLPA